MIWHAILSTDGPTPASGDLLLVAMPAPTANLHGIGRILTVTPRPGGHMPTVALTVSIETADDAAAKSAFPRVVALDIYVAQADAEKWHVVRAARIRKEPLEELR